MLRDVSVSDNVRAQRHLAEALLHSASSTHDLNRDMALSNNLRQIPAFCADVYVLLHYSRAAGTRCSSSNWLLVEN